MGLSPLLFSEDNFDHTFRSVCAYEWNEHRERLALIDLRNGLRANGAVLDYHGIAATAGFAREHSSIILRVSVVSRMSRTEPSRDKRYRQPIAIKTPNSRARTAKLRCHEFSGCGRNLAGAALPARRLREDVQQPQLLALIEELPRAVDRVGLSVFRPGDDRDLNKQLESDEE